MSLSKIVRDLHAQISKSVYVETDNSGRHRIATPFAFGDGDQPVIVLVPNGEGWMLSDSGSTLFRLGFQMDDDALAHPANKRRLNSALSMAGISRCNDELTKPLLNSDYAGALFDFVHALLKIDELGDFGLASQNPSEGKQSQLRKSNHRMTTHMPAKTIEVFEYVKRCALEPRIVTYGEVGKAVRLAPNGMDPQLNYIRDMVCAPRDLPCLSAIVVRKDTKIPGEGFTLDGKTIFTEGFRPWWCDVVRQVFATNWSNVNLDNHD